MAPPSTVPTALAFAVLPKSAVALILATLVAVALSAKPALSATLPALLLRRPLAPALTAAPLRL
jgi:hypothetical protein